MSSSTPGMDVPVSKVDHNATLPSTRPAAKAKVPEAPLKQSTSTSWNTKNLGLRVATDFTSGFLAAGMVAPLIAVIDKFVPSYPLSLEVQIQIHVKFAMLTQLCHTEPSCKMPLARTL
jgi:hypothetical protein